MVLHIRHRLCRFLAIFFILILFPTFIYSDEYRVNAGDILLITVYEHPDLTIKVRVNSKGEITFPLLGTVIVKDLSVNEIQKKLSGLLEKDYLVNPHVSVFIEQYRPNKVFVMGFVNKPGEYELFKDRPTTVLEVISMAGGFKDGAAPNGTKILRIEDNQEITIPIRVTDITKKGDKNKDVPVRPGDIVVVPESFF